MEDSPSGMEVELQDCGSTVSQGESQGPLYDEVHRLLDLFEGLRTDVALLIELSKEEAMPQDLPQAANEPPKSRVRLSQGRQPQVPSDGKPSIPSRLSKWTEVQASEKDCLDGYTSKVLKFAEDSKTSTTPSRSNCTGRSYKQKPQVPTPLAPIFSGQQETSQKEVLTS